MGMGFAMIIFGLVPYYSFFIDESGIYLCFM